MDTCPLTGKSCDKPRSLHVKQSIEGNALEMSMCNDCGNHYMASLKGGFVMHPLPMTTPVAPPPPPPPPKPAFVPVMILPGGLGIGPIQAVPGGFPGYQKVVEGIACSGCGSSLLEIAESKKIGCPVCYETFKSDLVPCIHKNQNGKDLHVGKRPKRMVRENQIEELTEQMALAVKDERYEDAARYRDEIKALKNV